MKENYWIRSRWGAGAAKLEAAETTGRINGGGWGDGEILGHKFLMVQDHAPGAKCLTTLPPSF